MSAMFRYDITAVIFHHRSLIRLNLLTRYDRYYWKGWRIQDKKPTGFSVAGGYIGNMVNKISVGLVS